MILQEKQAAATCLLSIDEIVASLKQRGYQHKFRREATCLYCIDLACWITPDSFIVDEYYHFEDTSNVDQDRVIYAITSLEGVKGFLVDTCFVYEDNISPEMMEKLKMEYALPGEISIQLNN